MKSASNVLKKMHNLRAVLYARQSRADEPNGNDELKSCPRQLTNARRFAQEQGWTVIAEHQDEGISGALDELKRPGLRAVLDLALAKRFDVLVVAKGDRMARDSMLMNLILSKLIKANVQTWTYQSQKLIDVSTATNKMLVNLESFAAEFQRESIRDHVIDGMKGHATEGRVMGGVVFGFTNIKIGLNPATGKYQYADFEVNKPEAKVVLKLFTLYASGLSPKQVAIALNQQRALAPGRCRDARWTRTAVRAALMNARYHGHFITKFRHEPRPITKIRPELSLIPEPLWHQVQLRLTEQTKIYLRTSGGRLQGKPVNSSMSSYLLSGRMGRCGLCGSQLSPTRLHWGTARSQYKSYVCHRARFIPARGEPCSNKVPLLIETAHREILKAVEKSLRDDRIWDGAINKLKSQLQLRPSEHRTRQRNLETELKTVETELGRLIGALKLGKQAPETIVAAINDLEAKKKDLENTRQDLEKVRDLQDSGWPKIQETIIELRKDWLNLSQMHLARSRQLLLKLVPGGFSFTPGRDRYDFRGEGTLQPIISGTIPLLSRVQDRSTWPA